MLSKKTTIQAKGIAALFIMVGHLLPDSTPDIVRFFFYGPVWVGLFFFFSGYGIQKKAIGSAKLGKEFLVNLVKKIWLPFAIAELLHLITLYVTLNQEFSAPRVLGCIFGAPLSNTVLWYVVELIVLEILFFVGRKIRYFDSKLANIPVWSMLYLLFMIASVIFDIGTWWYISTITFVMGLFFAQKEDLLERIGTKPIGVIVMVIAPILYILERLADLYDIGPYRLVSLSKNYYLTGLTIIMVPAVTLMIIICLINKQGENKALLSLGEASYYIYLLHITVKSWIAWGIGENMSSFAIMAIQITATILIGLLLTRLKKLWIKP